MGDELVDAVDTLVRYLDRQSLRRRKVPSSGLVG